MFENNNRFDGGRAEHKENPDHYFNWSIVNNVDDETAVQAEFDLPDIETAISQAKTAYLSKQKNEARTALVYEVDESDTNERPKRRIIWQANKSNPEGSRIEGEWQDF